MTFMGKNGIFVTFFITVFSIGLMAGKDGDRVRKKAINNALKENFVKSNRKEIEQYEKKIKRYFENNPRPSSLEHLYSVEKLTNKVGYNSVYNVKNIQNILYNRIEIYRQNKDKFDGEILWLSGLEKIVAKLVEQMEEKEKENNIYVNLEERINRLVKNKNVDKENISKNLEEKLNKPFTENRDKYSILEDLKGNLNGLNINSNDFN